jgi:dipeptidyl aminopeptidase/acylaminoacyl peptidase
MKHLLFLLIMLSSLFSFAQDKKILDHTVYNDWKKIDKAVLSKDGNFVAYTIIPHKGDGYLYLYDYKKDKLDSFPRGTSPQFSNSNYLSFKITPGYDTLRTVELNKVDKKKWPKDTLAIYILANDSLLKIANLKSLTVSEDSDWFAYTLESNELIESEKKKKKKCFLKKKTKEIAYESDGKVCILYNPLTKEKLSYKDITNVRLEEKGRFAALTIQKTIEDKEQEQIALLNLNTKAYFIDTIAYTSLLDFEFNHSTNMGALAFSLDTNKNKRYELALYNLNDFKKTVLIDTNSTQIPVEKSISSSFSLQFSEDDKALYFGLQNKPEAEVKDTLLESEKVSLDLWHYKDNRLQPQQLLEAKRDRTKSHTYCINLENKEINQLSNDSITLYLPNKITHDFAVGYSSKRYQGSYNWSMPWPEDHYKINLRTGETSLLKETVGYGGRLAPSGNYYTYFDDNKEEMILLDLKSGKESCITCDEQQVVWQEDVNGMPYTPGPLGVIGWEEGENRLWIQSKYDVFAYSIAAQKLVNLTNNFGKENQIRLEAREWDYDSIYLNFDNVYLFGFNEKTKARNVYKLHYNEHKTEIIPLLTTQHEIVYLKKAKEGENYLVRKMSVSDYPEITLYNKDFKQSKQISNTNPQQAEYNWATTELINWTSYDSIPLQGLLYKPENYDSTKSYPLLVYFYELYSDELHNHYVPKPTASIIYPTEYASAGYMVLIPDIRYKEGYPARSAYNCIMSATDEVLRLYPNIDSTRMGLQGQSWGGYQTAQLVTMTTRYKAAMAGAPVSNMFSAYGGIRWGSGLNRQFQYEKTQSRIGKTIWEAHDLYVENSPIFHLPKIQTPLLIMANDGDGAVPWYQGIEMFTGMKRLDKAVWMLNYNGDEHNLMKNANRMDLSIRMRQFFDYYLMDKPAPIWLTNGIPAIDKGKKFGFELEEEAQ